MEVHASALVHADDNELDSMPATYHRVGPGVRQGGLKEFSLVQGVRELVRELDPAICHFASLRSVLFGLMATRGRRNMLKVSSITGLGFLFIDNTLSSRLQRTLVGNLVSWNTRSQSSVFVFQNEDDRLLFAERGWSRHSRSLIVPGSGVDTNSFTFSALPAGDPVVLFPARYLTHKGIVEFIEAARSIRARRPEVTFRLAGGVDPNNPASVDVGLIAKAVDKGVVIDLGYQENMAAAMRDASVVCLPSYREGLPKVLIEGAATGRPLVATDVTGCRDVVREGINGYLAEVASSVSLAEAIERVLDGPMAEMAQASRRIAENEYGADAISAQFEALYRAER